jgi:hypothetical protein
LFLEQERKSFTTEDTEDHGVHRDSEKRNEEICFVGFGDGLRGCDGGWGWVAAYGFGDAEL